jgi:hypothetical protein
MPNNPNDVKKPSNNYSRYFNAPAQAQTIQRDDGKLQRDIEIAKRTAVPRMDLNDDPETLARVKHTMLPNESLGHWYARIGLGKSQIHMMSASEISAFVFTVEERDELEPPITLEPQPLPQTFFIDA